ncbi:MAG: methyl-accepting chemotaxis protein, partial [Clostridia bacterium]|nr:methyl-accepting chemotaxis protein [Clostridia bacterium]
FLQIIPKADFFRKIYEDIDLGKGSNIFIIDDQNTIVSSKDSNNTGKSIDEILPVSKSLNEAAGTSKDKGNKGVLWHNSAGKTMMVCYSANPGTNWKVVGIVPFDSLMQKTNAIFYVVTMLIIICALASLLISYMVTRSVTLPMGRISHSVEALKNGDFTKLLDVKFNDEISKFAEGFNRMISDIRAIIVDVHKSAENVVKSSDTIATHSQHAAASATQIAKAIQDMSEGSSEQAFEAQKGKEIMGALADNLNVVVENTSLVQDAAYEARNLSQNSLKVVDDLNSKAKETGLATDSIVSLINDLNSDMKQITNIVKVSVGISEQTNLLSLNAAIEAARAGDAGKGFAVVAEEVKKLADKSKAASVSISSIINSIVAKTNYMVEAAQNASKAIDKQMDAVVHTEKAFKTILDSTDNMVIQIERVNRLIRDMDELKAKAVCLMDRISEISEASAAASEEIGATTQEQISAASILADLADSLNEMAGSLEKTIAHFKV